MFPMKNFTMTNKFEKYKAETSVINFIDFSKQKENTASLSICMESIYGKFSFCHNSGNISLFITPVPQGSTFYI